VSDIQIRAAEASDAEAIFDIYNCPNVIANTLQLPYTMTIRAAASAVRSWRR
jgi:hypothetical protein